MTIVIILVVVAVVLLASGGLFVATRARRRGPAVTLPPVSRPVPPASAPVAVVAPSEAPAAPEEHKAGRPVLKDRLGRARGLLAGYFDQVRGRSGIDEATFDELEEALILADVGVATTTRVLDDLRDKLREGVLAANDAAALLQALQDDLVSIFEATSSRSPTQTETARRCGSSSVSTGSAKTTTIGKLALREAQAGRAVVLAAGDTFRAAAGEQLETWAERAGARIVRGADGADPSSVIFDAVQHAAAPRRGSRDGRHRRSPAHKGEPDGGASQGAPRGPSDLRAS